MFDNPLLAISVFSLIPLSLFIFTTIIFWSRNPVYSVLSFVVVVAHCVVLLISLDAEFLAYVLAIVYIGAIVVLFLFVVMMFQMKLFRDFRSYGRGALEFTMCGVIVSSMDTAFSQFIGAGYVDYIGSSLNTNLVLIVAQLLYNDYFFLTVLAALIMFTGILAAIVISIRGFSYVATIGSNKVSSDTNTGWTRALPTDAIGKKFD